MNIAIERVSHKDEDRIALKFTYDTNIIEKVKQIPGRKWSSTLQCWHIPDNEKSIEALKVKIPELDLSIFEANLPKDTKKSENAPIEFEVYYSKYLDFLKSKRYSQKTIKSYMKHIKEFFSFHNFVSPENISTNHIYNYINKQIIEKNYSESYHNQAINSIKGFFKTIYNKQFTIEEIKRPKKSKKLPSVLSKDEVKRLFDSITNLKHRTILMLIYSSGLRISEAVNLKLEDINRSQMLLTIRGGKGKKDRIVKLSHSILKTLEEYYKAYKPSRYIFEGKTTETYSVRSIQQVFQKAKKKAGIRRNATVHTLRHSYATHLMDSGVDLRIIQELLGHQSSKTTEIYTHVSTRNIQNIVSPLDDL